MQQSKLDTDHRRSDKFWFQWFSRFICFHKYFYTLQPYHGYFPANILLNKEHADIEKVASKCESHVLIINQFRTSYQNVEDKPL